MFQDSEAGGELELAVPGSCLGAIGYGHYVARPTHELELVCIVTLGAAQRSCLYIDTNGDRRIDLGANNPFAWHIEGVLDGVCWLSLNTRCN